MAGEEGGGLYIASRCVGSIWLLNISYGSSNFGLSRHWRTNFPSLPDVGLRSFESGGNGGHAYTWVAGMNNLTIESLRKHHADCIDYWNASVADRQPVAQCRH